MKSSRKNIVEVHPKLYNRVWKFVIISLIAILLLSFYIFTTDRYSGKDDTMSKEKLVSLQFETLRQNTAKLRDFFLAMPKGGDIHAHLIGSIYAECLIEQASNEGLCINLDNSTVSGKHCMSENYVPIGETYSNPKLCTKIINDWSVRNTDLLWEIRRDKFFNIVKIFGEAATNTSAIVAVLRSSAAKENVEYLELMTGAGFDAANLISKEEWDDNLSKTYNIIVDNGLISVAKSLNNRLIIINNDSLNILMNKGDPGSNVTVRYILTANRINSKEQVFGQLAAAFYTSNISNIVVGVNLLGPEDSLTSREDYSLHMKMIGYLHSIYPKVGIALHAGEMNLGIVPTDDLRFHIKEAIYVGCASRIGHGVDIMQELNSDETLQEMVRKQITVEIMPVSNQIIFNVSRKDHPFLIYFSRDIPIVLASDDAGILRTDLSEQFVIIATDYPYVKYRDFKKFIRNSIEYSFLDGRSIWVSKGDYSLIVSECSGYVIGSKNLTTKCKALLDSSDKARVEWNLEEDIAIFEKTYVENISNVIENFENESFLGNMQQKTCKACDEI